MKKITYYILKDKIPIATEDVAEWANFFGEENRQVDRTIIFENNAQVSTVFLGIDHGFSKEDDLPIIFETMVFSDDININNIKTVHFGAPYDIFIDL